MTVTVERVAAPSRLDLAGAARMPAAEVLSTLGTSDSGLTAEDAHRRLESYGPNALHFHRVSWPATLARQFRNPLLLLLLVSAAVAGVTGDATDAVIIAAIVAISVFLSFFNEYRAETAAAALHDQIRHEAVVLRDGAQREVDTTEVVPGDIVQLSVGNLVPADMRLLDADELECDEAVLTGESEPAVKTAAAAPQASGDDLPSCAFMGTVVHEGAGRGVVVATGAATAFGGIAAGLSEPEAASAFMKGLTSFSGFLVRVAGVLTAAIFIFNVVFHKPILEALLFSLSIAVGITPTLLPAIVTVSLATGSRALARRKVLVKRLVAIEDLGNIQLLFTDKTGTLTRGAVAFDRSLAPDGSESDAPLRFGLVCNEASLSGQGAVGGNTLDQALWRAPGAQQLVQQGDGPGAFKRLQRLPFDHERQRASVLVDGPHGRTVVTKGAPEAVLARCVDVPASAQSTLEALFSAGSRVVAVATRSDPGDTPLTSDGERDLHLAGFLTFNDPPKPDAGASIAKLRQLHVDVKIITGDNGTVAATVCRAIGLEPGRVLSGAGIEAMDDAALSTAIDATTVFARVTPEQKSRLINVARRRGTDVAFLGDGVNDAVALHHADVGISVESATDVAKDAADVVLLDKDLGVLAEGVMEGRRIFGNTIKYVLMATSSNFGNMFSAAVSSLFLTFLPMLPSQILLNNLLYDVGQLSIPTDRVDPEQLQRPAAWDIKFVRRFMVMFGPISSVFDFLTFFVMLGVLHAGVHLFRTGWFVESLATQTLVIYVIRTRRIPFLRSRPGALMAVLPLSCAVIGAVLPFTPVATVLGFTPLPPVFFAILLGMIITYLVLVEVGKTFFYGAHPRPFLKLPTTPRQRVERHISRRAAHFAKRTDATALLPVRVTPHG